MPKIKIKPFIINFFVALLLLGVHILALFSSTTFLGSNYSRKTLIDNYCISNLNGSSVVFKSNVSASSETINQIDSYKNKNDIELNTILGLNANNAEFNSEVYSLVGSIPSNENAHYNFFRVYSDDNWKSLDQKDCIFISDSLGMSLVPAGKDPKDYRSLVKNKNIDIKLSDSVYSFKIAGFYNTIVADSGWRSRGKYFDESFSNCIFINETFLHDKFSNVFQMLTSDTIDSGETFKRYESLIKSIGGNILTPTNPKETEILEKIDILNNETNVMMGLIFSIISPIVSLVALVVSIWLFDVKYLFEKFKWLTLIWCFVYLLISYVFVFITRNMLISLFGFNALGANKVSISIMSIYTFLLLVGILIKFFLYSKKKNKNKIVRYNI